MNDISKLTYLPLLTHCRLACTARSSSSAIHCQTTFELTAAHGLAQAVGFVERPLADRVHPRLLAELPARQTAPHPIGLVLWERQEFAQ